ncbi:MAG: DUF4340 domain-containing protein [Elusimicrobiota bacterium]|nr:DUF4340 domain-containing protein [Endomicrobiia bacterium]MDW8165400.1 DUF4340 domain-containing protein [Elusimicrobiota bacterium]
MKNYFRWIFLLFILLIILLIRVVKRSYYFSKQIFKNKEVVEVEFNSLDNKKINIVKLDKSWVVKTPFKEYKPNEGLVKEIFEKIKNFELLEIITNNPQNYSDYLVNTESATVVKIFFKKEKKPRILYLGKIGGFSFNEIYIRIENDPNVYLAKGIASTNFRNYFYEFCDKTLLKSNTEEINSLEISFQKKIMNLKKELKNGTTTWIDLKTNRNIDVQKVENFLRLFLIFTSDVILEEEIDYNKLKEDFKILLNFKENANVEITFFKEQKLRDFPVYPVKIKYTNRSPSIETIGDVETLYGVYKYKYDDFTQRITPFFN